MTDANRAMLRRVVKELGDLSDNVVFVGGAIAGLLITEPAGDPIRQTFDVACLVEVGSSRLNYRQIEKNLLSLGWVPGSQQEENDPLCRFRKKGLSVDVMPTNVDILGFASKWAPEAFEHSLEQKLGRQTIRVVSAPYFLALKIEAFLDRGENDYYGSHDLEDLLAVVEGRPTIVEETFTQTTKELRAFLKRHLKKMWPRLVSEAIPGATRGNPARAEVIETRLASIRDGKS